MDYFIRGVEPCVAQESTFFRFCTVEPEDFLVPFYESQHDNARRCENPEYFPEDPSYIVKEADGRHHHGIIKRS